jgi:hypothetical protein
MMRHKRQLPQGRPVREEMTVIGLLAQTPVVTAATGQVG